LNETKKTLGFLLNMNFSNVSVEYLTNITDYLKQNSSYLEINYQDTITQSLDVLSRLIELKNNGIVDTLFSAIGG